MAKARRTKRIPFSTLEQAAASLRVLSHPHRLRIVEVLLNGPASVTDLATDVELAPAAMSQHLSQMRAQGIVASRRNGRQVFYEVISPNAVHLIDCIMKHGPGRQNV